MFPIWPCVFGYCRGFWPFFVCFFVGTVLLANDCFGSDFLLIEPRKHNRESTNVFLIYTYRFIIFSSAKLRNLTKVQSIRFTVCESAFRSRAAFVVTLGRYGQLAYQMHFHIGAATGYLFCGKLLKRFGAYRLLSLEIVCNRTTNFISLLPYCRISGTYGTYFHILRHRQVAIGGLLQKNYTDTQRATLDLSCHFLGVFFLELRLWP